MLGLCEHPNAVLYELKRVSGNANSLICIKACGLRDVTPLRHDHLWAACVLAWAPRNGINSDDYSFAYVTGWAGDGDKARDAIKASDNRIQRAVDSLLTAMGGEEMTEVA